MRINTHVLCCYLAFMFLFIWGGVTIFQTELNLISTDISSVYGVIGAVLTVFAFVPQVIKSVKTLSASDISLGLLVFTFFGNLSFVLHGLSIGSKTFVVTGLSIMILVIPILYVKRQNSKMAIVIID